MIWETFLPRLFFVNMKTLSPVVGALSTMPINKPRLGLLNTVTSAQEKYLISTRGSTELVRSVTGGGELSNADHLRTLSEERRDGKKDRDVAYESRLKGLVSDIKGTNKRLLLCAKSTGYCLIVRSTAVSGKVMSATYFWDFKCACYNVSPVNLQSHCDGCGTSFGVMHTLSCSIRGLVIVRHKEIRDKILYQSQRIFT